MKAPSSSAPLNSINAERGKKFELIRVNSSARNSDRLGEQIFNSKFFGRMTCCWKRKSHVPPRSRTVSRIERRGGTFQTVLQRFKPLWRSLVMPPMRQINPKVTFSFEILTHTLFWEIVVFLVILCTYIHTLVLESGWMKQGAFRANGAIVAAARRRRFISNRKIPAIGRSRLSHPTFDAHSRPDR